VSSYRSAHVRVLLAREHADRVGLCERHDLRGHGMAWGTRTLRVTVLVTCEKREINECEPGVRPARTGDGEGKMVRCMPVPVLASETTEMREGVHVGPGVRWRESVCCLRGGHSLSFSENGYHLLALSSLSSVVVWDLCKHKTVKNIELGELFKVSKVLYDASALFWGMCRNEGIRVFAHKTWEELARFGEGGPHEELCHSRKGQLLVRHRQKHAIG